MAIFAIADLHLSTLVATNKSMEVFGHRWQDYIKRIETNWKRIITPADTVIIPGDVSWALSLNEALSDLSFLNSLPGHKIIGKGNHDFWWSTMKKHGEFFQANGIESISFLYNNAYEVEDLIIAGTRGWYHDEQTANTVTDTDFDKLVKRETQRLKMSLDAATAIKSSSPQKEIVVFMHFPPIWNGKESEQIISLLLDYNIKQVYYGHIHGNYSVPSSFNYKGIEMNIISADYLEFIPKLVYHTK